MTTLNDITVRALKMHKADGIRHIAKALKEEQDRAHDLYCFRSRHGSRYAYTCYQLKDALCGVWG